MVVYDSGRAYVGNFGFDMHGGAPMAPADLALVHPDGRVEVAASDLLSGRECVRVVEGGDITDRIEASQTCFACTLGGDDRDTLYVLTAPGSGPDEVGGKGQGRLEMVRVGRTG